MTLTGRIKPPAWGMRSRWPHEKPKAVSPPASLADATCFWRGKSRQKPLMPRRRPAAPGPLRFSPRTAGSELAPLRSLRHAEPDFSVRGCDTRRHRGRGVATEPGVHVGKHPPHVTCPPAAVAAAHCRAGRKKGRRMSERREQSHHSEFGGPRPDRNAQGNAPEAASAAVGPAASPGSVSWLLLGAPRSHSRKPAAIPSFRIEYQKKYRVDNRR